MIIAIASGKGGTGKTTVAVNLALSIGSCTLVDCDVEEPDANLFLRVDAAETEDVSVPFPVVEASRCNLCGRCAKLCEYNAIAVLNDSVMVFKELCHSCGLCAIACPRHAIVGEERVIGSIASGHRGEIRFLQGTLNVGEARATPIIKRLKEKAGKGGVIILDCPPGTGCPVVESISGSDYCILVTEPTPFGLYDLGMAADLCRTLGVLCGVVVNRDGAGDSDIEGYCKERGIPILLRIPFDRKIAELYSEGAPFVEAMPEKKKMFRSLYEKISEMKKTEERIIRRRDILEAAGVRGCSLLDVGAGMLGIVAAKEYGCTVTTIDNSEDKLKEVEDIASKEGVSIKLDKGDAAKMPYSDASFDCAICLGTLHHVPERLRPSVARECFRVAGKKAVYFEYTKNGFGKIHPDGEYRRVDLKKLEKILRGLGPLSKKEGVDYNLYIVSKRT